MTNYGTIPSAPPESSTAEFVSLAKERIRSGLGTRRPWKELLSAPHAFNLPTSFSNSISRIRTNVSYFHTNYAIVVLLVLFLSLLWQPISLVVFILAIAAWLFLYFLRDQPLVIFHRTIGDRAVLIGLSAITVVLLYMTDVTTNIVAGLSVGVAVVVVHAALRNADDLSEDEEGGSSGSGARLPLKDTASSSFSSSP